MIWFNARLPLKANPVRYAAALRGGRPAGDPDQPTKSAAAEATRNTSFPELLSPSHSICIAEHSASKTIIKLGANYWVGLKLFSFCWILQLTSKPIALQQ